MTRLGRWSRKTVSQSAVETALLDAGPARRAADVELLGGRRRGTCRWPPGLGDTAKDIAEAERMLDAPPQHLQAQDRRARSARTSPTAAIKRALGERGAVRVDVNMAWSETEAAWGMAALADAGCELVEQPVASAAALGRLMRRFPVALMADESLHGPESAFEIAKNAGADVFAVKIEQSGGPSNALRVAAIADAAGIELYGGTMLEGAVGTIASAHVFATFTQLQWGTELFGPLLITEEILAQPLDYSDFQLTVPSAPGLGITLDEDRVQFFRRDAARKSVSVAATHPEK